MRRQSAFALAILLLGTSAGAAQPRFVGLGDLPGGGEFSEARDVSSDGSVVVGTSRSAAQPGGEAFRWTAQDGMQGLGSLASTSPFSEAMAVSADGGTIVGSTRSPGNLNICDGKILRAVFEVVGGECTDTTNPQGGTAQCSGLDPILNPSLDQVDIVITRDAIKIAVDGVIGGTGFAFKVGQTF